MFRRTSGVMEKVPATEDRRMRDEPDGAEFGTDGERAMAVPTADRPLPPPAYAVPLAGPRPNPMLPASEHESSVVVSRQRLSVASLLGAVAGIALVAVGLIAVLRGGLGGPIDEPVVEVMGLTHTPLLGLVDIGMGLLLLLAAVTASRGALALLGSLGIVAGAVALAETSEVQQRLAAESAFGWMWIGAGALIALTAWMLPVYDREVRKVRDEVHAG